MKQKTAMQELIDELSFIEGLKDEIDLSQKSILKTATIKNALEKEKEQILDAHLNGQQDHHFSLESRMAESEDYYNQTYNQNK
jgi:hypothetical protein